MYEIRMNQNPNTNAIDGYSIISWSKIDINDDSLSRRNTLFTFPDRKSAEKKLTNLAHRHGLTIELLNGAKWRAK
ncbi:MAG: hypothetical protein ACYCZJ_13290 [Sulfuriferula sp.]